MTRKRDRTFALIAAIVFFASTVAFSGFVVWEMSKGSEDQRALEEAIKQQTQNQPREGTLQGTKLANFTPVEKVDKLEIIELTPGTGAEAKLGSTITAHYTGALVKDGTIFQSSLDTGSPFKTQLVEGGLIEGWIQGIPGMKAGGKRRLVIPAAQAYKEEGRPGIPPNADLVFDIELIAVE